ncbi:MAG TPA: glycosyl hydrolase [Candidatus Methylomirabilis sp.]|nr:glycosyl hydrolase [Candidatus Methylomirabilis sp.]
MLALSPETRYNRGGGHPTHRRTLTIDARFFDLLHARSIGPHRGGRVVAVAGHPTVSATFYFGACAGGVWKSVDGGTYWENISDGFFRASAVGAIAVAPSDPNVIYAGTGEACIRGNVSHGDGVYRSRDGGRTWDNTGLGDTRHIGRVRVHPRDADCVYVAALGHAWGPNRQRGVFRSRDGGGKWEHVLFRSEGAGAVDLSLDPQNPRMLFAAIWEARRTPWGMTSGGPDSSLYRSTDGGDTWTDISRRPGLPKGGLGRIGVVVSPADGRRVYAVVEAADGALFRSDDGGDTWQRGSEEAGLRGRPWYYMHVFADPNDADTVWVADYSLWKSTDGGRSFVEVATPHGDNHDLWIDPADSRRMIEGNDGGACVSYNGGQSWSTIYNQPTAQFYHVCTDDQRPYRVYGSQQDNWAISIPSQSHRGAITATDWVQPGGGESGYIALKPGDPAIVVGGSVGSGPGMGRLIHYDHRSGQERVISVWPEAYGMGIPPSEHRYRFQWTFPVFYSRWDSRELWMAGNRVFRSLDEGQSWEVVSPDLTRNDPEKLGPSGGPITRDNTGAEVYCTIFALAESLFERDVLWAGTDDGLVHLSRDRGRTWRPVTPQELPEWTLVSMLEPSPHDGATCYLAATRYKLDDPQPYLFKTADYGRTWTRITSGLPLGEITRVIREDPARRGLLYAGTETGLWVSLDDGDSWQPFQAGIPVSPIYDLVVKETDLVVATHGRSFWIVDDLTPLHQLTGPIAGTTARLFAPRPTVRWRAYRGHGMKPGPGREVAYRLAGPLGYAYRQVETPTGEKKEQLLDAGENPPNGVVVRYWLPESPVEDVRLTFLDGEGREIRTFTSRRSGDGTNAPPAAAPSVPAPPAVRGDDEPRPTKAAGANSFLWNLRGPDATRLPDNTGRGGTAEMLAGPRVAPGRYQVRLTVGDQTLTQPFEIVKDPRVGASDAELRQAYELAKRAHDLLGRIHDTVLVLRDVRAQAAALAGRVSSPTIADAAASLQRVLTAIEEELVQVRSADPRMFPSKLNTRVATLAVLIEHSDAAPTTALRELVESHSEHAEIELAKLDRCLGDDLVAFNALCRDGAVPAIVPRRPALS